MDIFSKLESSFVALIELELSYMKAIIRVNSGCCIASSLGVLQLQICIFCKGVDQQLPCVHYWNRRTHRYSSQEVCL